MSTGRRCLGLLALLVTLVVAVGVMGGAGAATSRFAGSKFDQPLANGYKHPDPELSVTGVFKYNSATMPDQPAAPSSSLSSVYFTIVARDDYPLPEGCTVPSLDAVNLSPTDDENTDPAIFQYSFFSVATFPCNGRYDVSAVACTAPAPCSATSPPPQTPTQEWHKLKVTISIAASPGPVPKLTATRGEGRNINLKWEPVANPEPDFAGYLVERAVGSERYGIVKKVTGLSYTDRAPDEGGTIRYRLRALRKAPGGEVPTDPGAGTVATISVPAAPTTTVAGGSGGGNTSGTLPPRSSYHPPASSDSPTFGTPDTVDGGYDEFLPYGEGEPGTEDAILPDDGFAAVQYDDEESAGLLIPVASALVLVMWAVHIRHITRLARH